MAQDTYAVTQSNRSKPLPSLERLNELFALNTETGALTWRVNLGGPGAVAGRSAGTMRPDGYLSIMVDRKRYPAHRLVWKIHNEQDPVGLVDHIDGITTNNRPDNLRDATGSQNCWNSKPNKRNTSGHRGVFFYKRTGKWKAQINANRKSVHVGYFLSKEDAVAAADAAITALHGQFAYGAEVAHG